MTNKEESYKLDAMRSLEMRELPQLLSDESCWVEAVARIRLADMSFAWAVVRNTGSNVKIKRIWGNTAAVAEVVEIRPYKFFNKSLIPQFKSREQKLFYLKAKVRKNIDFDSLTDEEIENELFDYAMLLQKEYDAESEKIERMKSVGNDIINKAKDSTFKNKKNK